MSSCTRAQRGLTIAMRSVRRGGTIVTCRPRSQTCDHASCPTCHAPPPFNRDPVGEGGRQQGGGGGACQSDPLPPTHLPLPTQTPVTPSSPYAAATSDRVGDAPPPGAAEQSGLGAGPQICSEFFFVNILIFLYAAYPEICSQKSSLK